MLPSFLSVEHGQIPSTTDLAERYCDFRILITLCQESGCYNKLKDYVVKFADQVSKSLVCVCVCVCVCLCIDMFVCIYASMWINYTLPNLIVVVNPGVFGLFIQNVSWWRQIGTTFVLLYWFPFRTLCISGVTSSSGLATSFGNTGICRSNLKRFIIIVVHGGHWRGENLLNCEQCLYFIRGFASLVIVLIVYRLTKL